MDKSEMVSAHTSWRLGGLSASSWSVLAYLLIVAALALPRLGHGWPLYGPAEYITGSYPLIWLVYICLPLLARDCYLALKGRLEATIELKLFGLSLLPISLLFYRYLFGWL